MMEKIMSDSEELEDFMEKKPGCLAIWCVTAVMLVPMYYAYGFVFFQYWEWFAIPIAESNFEYTLPTISLTTWAIISWVLYKVLQPVTIASTLQKSKDGLTVHDLIYCTIYPFVHVATAIVLGFIIKFFLV
jgi:hypothetical protein